MRYTASSVFDTFPFPAFNSLVNAGSTIRFLRDEIRTKNKLSLNDAYNRIHERSETSQNIQRLRECHIQTDIAVSKAYSWVDLNLDHGFHETKQGMRFTISDTARKEVLQRLLKLNHERYAEEVAQGLHDKKKKGAAKKRKTAKSATKSLPGFGDDDEEG